MEEGDAVWKKKEGRDILLCSKEIGRRYDHSKEADVSDTGSGDGSLCIFSVKE